jgi:hypothetical protein
MLRIDNAPPVVPAIESDGHSCPRSDKNVRRKFGDVCKLLWPEPAKPDVELALIGKVDPRTARRWMRGEQDDVPWKVLKVVIDKMFEPVRD